MLIRETTTYECWCNHCSTGQMSQIHDILLEERVDTNQLIGRIITCRECGKENEIEDVLVVVPTSFIVCSKTNISKAKSNEEMMKWLIK